MLKKGTGRMKPWRRAAGSGGEKVPKVKPSAEHNSGDWHNQHLRYTVTPQMATQPPHGHNQHLRYNGMMPYPPPQLHSTYGIPFMPSYQPLPPSYQEGLPTHHSNHHPPPHNNHKKDDNHKSNHHDGKKGDHGDHHHGPPHPPPPPPGYIKRALQYVYDSLKKRPLLYAFLLTNTALFAHRQLNPEAHRKHMLEFFSVLQKSAGAWDTNSSNNEKIKITKLNDSLQNYSTSFKKASSGSTVASAFELLHDSSLLKHMKELEKSLSEEKIQEITRLTQAFRLDNERLTSSLGAAASQLRHCQLMGIRTSSTINGSTGVTPIDAVAREQSNKVLQTK
jgi:hypothetical protein